MGKVCSLSGDAVQSAIPPISLKRQARIREVQDKFDGGWKVKDLAEYFGISPRAIFKDLKAAKDLNRVLLEGLDQQEVLGREIRFLQQLGREAMRRYSLSRNDGAKLGFMRTALTIHEKLVKLLQTTGLLKKVPERLDIIGAIPFDDDVVRKEFYAWLKLAREKGEKNLGL